MLLTKASHVVEPSITGAVYPALGGRAPSLHGENVKNWGHVCLSPQALIISKILATVTYCLKFKLFILETKTNNKEAHSERKSTDLNDLI